MRCTDKEKLDAVAESLKKAWYEPYDQMYGYLTTGIETYITRQENAREIIKTVDRLALSDYLKKIKK